MSKKIYTFTILVIILAMITPMSVFSQETTGSVQITLLHTNDFHGRLEADSSGRGGSANLASVINNIRAAEGDENVALLDAGDVYFAAPAVSQLLMGESTIDIYNMMGYDLAVFGNHEFDKGQAELALRVDQSDFPWLGANVVLEGTDWDLPTWAEPYEILELGSGKNKIKLGVLGLAGEETPEVTLLGTTDGLVFKDLTETILHYYDEIMAQVDAMVVVVHMGTADSGPYKGLVTVAQELIDAGYPVDLMIGGHQHQALFAPVYVGDTAIVSAGFYGRWLGRVDLTIDKATKQLTVDGYQLITILETWKKLANLTDKVNNAYTDGEIDNAGVLNSLLVKLNAASAAWEKGKTKVFVNNMTAFINEV
ncbi:MAG TPA: metallophosphatase, partial [Anaerolineales bacterium]